MQNRVLIRTVLHDRPRPRRLHWGGVVLAACVIPWSVATQDTVQWKPVSFAILEDYDAGDDLAEVRADFELFERLEIRTWRGSLGWDDYEPERGRYDFACSSGSSRSRQHIASS